MKTIARLFAFLSAAASSLLYARIRAPINPLKGSLWILRLLAGAVTPFIALGGAVAAGLALLARSPAAIFAGMLGAVAAVRDMRRVTAPHPGFAQAFGVAWERAIAPEQQTGMLQRRWTWHLPAAPEPRWQRNVSFWTLPGTDRRLLCDLWQPPSGVIPSGHGITRSAFWRSCCDGLILTQGGAGITTTVREEAPTTDLWRMSAVELAETIDPALRTSFSRPVLSHARSSGSTYFLVNTAQLNNQFSPVVASRLYVSLVIRNDPEER